MKIPWRRVAATPRLRRFDASPTADADGRRGRGGAATADAIAPRATHDLGRYLTLTLHDDLARDRGLVLLRGDVDAMLRKTEAEHIIEQTIQAYCVGSRFSDAKTGPLVFNQNPDRFDLDEMLRNYPSLVSLTTN